MKSFVLLAIGAFVISCGMAQNTFDVYISNNGSDSNAGNKPSLPKKTINGAFANPSGFIANGVPVKIGLQAGSLFNEAFDPAFPVKMNTYGGNGNKNQFVILNGTSSFDTGWKRTEGRTALFEQNISLTGFTGYGINGVGQYSFIYVFEIDKELERIAPFTARKPLTFVNSEARADETPGSFYEPVTTDENPKKIYIHPTDGNSPNQHQKYRYEVTVKDHAVNSTYQEGNNFERLWVRGYGAGNGMIPAGTNSTFNHMIFGPGAGIHHLGLRGASVNNSLFLPAAKNVTGFALVFYDVEGGGRHNTISNAIFLDIKDCVYTHHSYGSNFGALELNNVFAFADSTDYGGFVATQDTDSIFLKNVSAYQYKYGYAYGWAKYVDIKNAAFVDAMNGVGFGYLNTQATINNTFIKTKGADNLNGIELSYSIELQLSNSIIHLRSEGISGNPDVGAFILRAGLGDNHINATGNIFICDVDPSRKVLAAGVNTNSGVGTTTDRWQNNVYILLRGDKLYWRVTNPVTNNGGTDVFSFANWKFQSGQDKNSLFFDLRNDPRGLKAIFADPEKGDYALANTLEGNQIRALRAGMTNPISCFVKKPTYEQAAALIMNDEMLSVDMCRNPCVQNNIRGYSQLVAKQLPGRRIQLSWNLDNEKNVDHYELLRSFENTDFNSIKSFTPTGDSLYTFIDSALQSGIEYRYSIAVVSKLGGKCYSDTKTSLVENANTAYSIYPNPSDGKIRIGLNGYSGLLKLKIINVMGMVVYSKEINCLYGIPPVIDLSIIAKGMYWARIETGEKTVVQSFLLR